MDLISRQAAIDAMDECYWSIMGDKPPKLDEKTALYVDLKQAVKRLPTAEKKGKWIVHKSPDKYHCGMVECPFCREELIAEPNEYCCCPKCGARMEQ